MATNCSCHNFLGKAGLVFFVTPQFLQSVPKKIFISCVMRIDALQNRRSPARSLFIVWKEKFIFDHHWELSVRNQPSRNWSFWASNKYYIEKKYKRFNGLKTTYLQLMSSVYSVYTFASNIPMSFLSSSVIRFSYCHWMYVREICCHLCLMLLLHKKYSKYY